MRASQNSKIVNLDSFRPPELWGVSDVARIVKRVTKCGEVRVLRIGSLFTIYAYVGSWRAFFGWWHRRKWRPLILRDMPTGVDIDLHIMA